MKIVVGLGNPGLIYRGTRHNAGATAVQAFAKLHGFVFKPHRSFKSLIAQKKRTASNDPEDMVVCLVLPQTFMNLSGDAVALVAQKNGVTAQDIFVVYDDVALPLGSLRVRPSGSAGGHNGLSSVITRLKTADIPRLRIGIGRGDERVDLKGHVLSRFTRGEAPAVRQAIERAAAAIDVWISQGIHPCMNLFNRPTEIPA